MLGDMIDVLVQEMKVKRVKHIFILITLVAIVSGLAYVVARLESAKKNNAKYSKLSTESSVGAEMDEDSDGEQTLQHTSEKVKKTVKEGNFKFDFSSDAKKGKALVFRMFWFLGRRSFLVNNLFDGQALSQI